ncbi:MAG: class II aldolase/adducin family protein [Halioglobus sp.]
MSSNPENPADAEVRDTLVATYRDLLAAGLGIGTSGNVSCRIEQGMLVTPTGIPPLEMRPEQLVAVSLEGEPLVPGQMLPSSEWHMHAAIYSARADAQAIVHCHSRYATTLACAHRSIPAIHYMIAVTGTREIPLAPYATFGTDALARSTVATLGTGYACLLANHGQITLGPTPGQALKVAQEVEELAATYWNTLLIGGGKNLNDQQMAEVEEAFQTYGQQR